MQDQQVLSAPPDQRALTVRLDQLVKLVSLVLLELEQPAPRGRQVLRGHQARLDRPDQQVLARQVRLVQQEIRAQQELPAQPGRQDLASQVPRVLKEPPVQLAQQVLRAPQALE